jgi:hypothetical protein
MTHLTQAIEIPEEQGRNMLRCLIISIGLLHELDPELDPHLAAASW